MKRILFVCLGNICRSPSAEAVMKKLVEDAGLQSLIEIDSAGIIGWHSGESADARMIEHGRRRGYALTSKSRQFNAQTDFDSFDYILGMDNENMRDLKAKDPRQKYKDKLFLVTAFNKTIPADIVPDPYYGGPEGFENVLEILEDACSGLLERVKQDLEK